LIFGPLSNVESTADYKDTVTANAELGRMWNWLWPILQYYLTNFLKGRRKTTEIPRIISLQSNIPTKDILHKNEKSKHSISMLCTYEVTRWNLEWALPLVWQALLDFCPNERQDSSLVATMLNVVHRMACPAHLKS
jgi:hypothetical protein